MKKREQNSSSHADTKTSKSSWQEKRAFASHQITDRTTSEDKAVMDVCKPPLSDPFNEQREGMKSLSIFHQTKRDSIS